jgi:Holliday junction resolvase RusA-like endonuclease
LHNIQLKPMSVNEAWQGKRFKTATYTRYERDMLLLLPKTMEIPEGNLRVYYEFGLSNSCSDYDNMVKPFQDILQKKYGFNDSRIMEAIIKKVIVKKRAEYIKFGIFSADD